MEMPPREPLVYRLYEIVQNYGYAYKAVLNEKFGDGIMSAISFSTKVEKETDDKGDWVKITLRGKWYVLHMRFCSRDVLLTSVKGFLSPVSRWRTGRRLYISRYAMKQKGQLIGAPSSSAVQWLHLPCGTY